MGEGQLSIAKCTNADIEIHRMIVNEFSDLHSGVSPQVTWTHLYVSSDGVTFSGLSDGAR